MLATQISSLQSNYQSVLGNFSPFCITNFQKNDYANEAKSVSSTAVCHRSDRKEMIVTRRSSPVTSFGKHKLTRQKKYCA